MSSACRPAVPIAIVGIGCRLPGGVRDADSYWQLMSRGRCAIREIPSDRWALDGFWDPRPDLPDRSYSKWGGFLDDVRSFDPAYFAISPREAEGMDPQQRLLLMVAVEAAQDAGIHLSRLRRETTGVFVGVSNVDYGLLQRYRPSHGEMQAGTGTALSIVANRVSNRLDLSGPSMGVDTACSSALVAVDTACRHLADGSCTYALAGGVNILLDPRMFITFSRAHMLSPTGRIRAFDESADGFVRGEGAGLVLLRRLDDAIADGDDVLAVIRSTAVNQDGRTGTITEPSCEAQIAMLRSAIARADVAPEHFVYAEAHGTGTPVGDPIEARAIGTVLGGKHRDRNKLPIGSVKTNIGHLEPAAGIAGLIKAALVLKHRQIPPSLGFQRPNTSIDLETLGLTVASQAIELPVSSEPECAVVNSFGFGGTNACAVVQSYDAARRPSLSAKRHGARAAEAEAPPLVFPLSGPTARHVEAYAARLLNELSSDGPLSHRPLNGIAAALGVKRESQEYRAAVVARTREELKERLDYLAHGRDWPLADRNAPPQIIRSRARDNPKLVFTMSGQGGQWWAMGRELLTREPVFRRVFEEFDRHFVPVSGWSTLEALSADEATSKIDDAAITPAVMFAFQVGLAAIWKSRGIEPDIVLGHSFGEVTAAHLAGAIGMADVAKLVKYRGLIRGAVDRKGTMAAIGLGPEAIAAYLPSGGSIEIGGYNSPSLVTLTGEERAIDELIAKLNAEDPSILTRKLALDFAYHSSWFEPVAELFKTDVGTLTTAAPKLPVISTVTGELNNNFTTEYWWRNLRYPVLYQKGVETALGMGGAIFLELGPHRTLSSMTAACAAGVSHDVTTVSTLDRRWGDFMSIAVATAQVWTAGVDIDWPTATQGDPSTVRLPLQPWLLREIWTEPEEAARHLRPPSVHPLLGRRSDAFGYTWRNDLSLSSHAWLADHRLDGTCVMPAAAYLEMLSSAAREILGADAVELVDISFPAALYIGEDDEIVLETTYDDARRRIDIRSRSRGDDAWESRASAQIFPFHGDLVPPNLGEVVTDEDVHRFYSNAETLGYGWGRHFRGLKRLTRTVEGVSGQIDVGTECIGEMTIDPRALDSAFQLMLACSDIGNGVAPVSIERAVVRGSLRQKATAFAHVAPTKQHEIEAGIWIEGGARNYVCVDALRAIPRQKSESVAPRGSEPYCFIEDWRDLDIVAPPQNTGAWTILACASDPRASLIAQALKARGFACEIADLETCLENPCELGALTVVLMPNSPEASTIISTANDAAWLAVRLGQWAAQTRSKTNALTLHFVTCQGLCTTPSAADQVNIAHAAAIGAIRTIKIELPSVDVRIIDTDSTSQSSADTICDVLTAGTREVEIALRGNRILCSRLAERDPLELPDLQKPRSTLPPTTNFALKQSGLTGPESLSWRIVERPTPAPHEVTIEVQAVGLNFRDVMAVAGLLPTDAEPVPAVETLGLEMAGVVIARGTKVRDLKIGDLVCGMGTSALQRFVTWPREAVTPIDRSIDPSMAATIPSASLTAHYALNEQARLKNGETLLVHSAAGGVGLAAIAMARRVGAHVIATAGTDEKRDCLRSIGCELVLDSRKLDFSEHVRSFTGGKGVDVILNSLGGAFIEKGLGCLAPYGRFVELGKRDVWGDGTIVLKALRNNISFHVVDLAALLRDRPAEAQRLLREINQMWKVGDIAPLPATTFAASRVRDAFRTFSEAKHIGKIVVDMRDPNIKVSCDPTAGFNADPNGTYLVTGGTSGFGASVAKWLVARGAGRVIAASRSGSFPEHSERIEGLKLDVYDSIAVSRTIQRLCQDDLPLKGVIHAAVVYSDALLQEMTRAQIDKVLAPKVSGAINLAAALLHEEAAIDFFVSFSSLAQVVGWPGQANYAAANTSLEALSQNLRSQDIRAYCINWGALKESGHVARSGQMQGYLESAGWIAMTDEQALHALGNVLVHDAASVTIARADWPRLLSAYPALAGSPRFAHLANDAGPSRERTQLSGLTGAELQAAALKLVRQEAAKVLRANPGDFAEASRLDEAGIDSLSSFELRNRIGQAIGTELPMSRYAAARTFDSLAVLTAALVTERSADRT